MPMTRGTGPPPSPVVTPPGRPAVPYVDAVAVAGRAAAAGSPAAVA